MRPVGRASHLGPQPSDVEREPPPRHVVCRFRPRPDGEETLRESLIGCGRGERRSADETDGSGPGDPREVDARAERRSDREQSDQRSDATRRESARHDDRSDRAGGNRPETHAGDRVALEHAHRRGVFHVADVDVPVTRADAVRCDRERADHHVEIRIRALDTVTDAHAGGRRVETDASPHSSHHTSTTALTRIDVSVRDRRRDDANRCRPPACVRAVRRPATVRTPIVTHFTLP